MIDQIIDYNKAFVEQKGYEKISLSGKNILLTTAAADDPETPKINV